MTLRQHLPVSLYPLSNYSSDSEQEHQMNFTRIKEMPYMISDTHLANTSRNSIIDMHNLKNGFTNNYLYKTSKVMNLLSFSFLSGLSTKYSRSYTKNCIRSLSTLSSDNNTNNNNNNNSNNNNKTKGSWGLIKISILIFFYRNWSCATAESTNSNLIY
jgi:hypothetical protein